MKFCILILSAFLLAFSSCNTASEKSAFDRRPILENLSENLIIPSYKQVLVETSSLVELLAVFKNRPTEENLQNMRLQWKELAEAWKQAEPFNFGPIENSFIENQIYYWPIESAGLEAAINSYDQQDGYLATVGSNKKGIAAIEYLLFVDELDQSIVRLQDEQRISFLQLLCENLQKHLSSLIEKWTADYQQGFVENTGNRATSSLTLVANEMIFLLEKVKNQKLAVPMGRTEINSANPELVEAPYSNYSLALIKESLKAIQAVFNGGEGKGMDDYLNALDIKNDQDKPLSQQINEQFNKAVLAAEAVETDLSQAIAVNDPALDQLYLEVLDLTIIIKNDMMSQLGLLVIFSDNDGD